MTLYVRSGGAYQVVDFDDLTRRDAGVYTRFQELFVRDAGIYKQVWRADGPPPAPTSLGATAINGGRIDVTWAYPANDENDYNRVEVQNPGDTSRFGTNYPGTLQTRTGYSHGSAVNLQARTVDNGGQVSAWTTVPGVFALNAGPSPVAYTAFFWDGSNWHMRWNDPANPYNDISAIQVYLRNDAEGTWTLVGQYGWTGQANREIAVAGRGWDTLHHSFIRTINAAGSADTGVASQWTPPQPGTEKFIACDEGNSYAMAAGAWRDDGTVRQGMFAPTPMGLHFGCMFYGSKLWEAGHGYQPVGGDIFMIRNGTEGFTGPVFFTGHGYLVNPRVGPTGEGQASWTSVSEFGGSGASAWEPLPTSFLAGTASGVARGVGIFTFSSFQSQYKVFLGPALNGFAGAIRLRW